MEDLILVNETSPKTFLTGEPKLDLARLYD